MKKLLIIALLALGLTGYAQTGKRSWADKKVELMTNELSLTGDQQKLLLPLFEKQKELYDDIKENPSHEEKNKAGIRVLRKQMDEVLTPEQLELQKALRAKKK